MVVAGVIAFGAFCRLWSSIFLLFRFPAPVIIIVVVLSSVARYLRLRLSPPSCNVVIVSEHGRGLDLRVLWRRSAFGIVARD